MSDSIRMEAGRSLRHLCTIGIGGPAKWYLEVRSIEEMQEAFKKASKLNLRTFILGKGSNTLFDDKGFDGLVIHNKISFCNEISDGMFHVGAGFSFSRLGAQTARQGWSGLEFASGIPGTVGGAVFMNAGANGSETEESLASVDYVTEKGELKHFDRHEITFGYRSSSFQSLHGAIVGATFSLTPSCNAKSKQLSIIEYRTKTQPYGKKSAGCMFRNPPSQTAGALIEACGLKGSVQGEAQVSSLHGNFLINTNQASSADVLALVRNIQTQVKEKYGIELESEVRYIPYRDETISS